MQQNWWEQDQVVQPGGPRTIVVGPADPTRALNARRTQQQIDDDAATAPLRRRQLAAQVSKAEADAEEAHRTLTSAPTPDPALASSIRDLGLDELLASVEAARKEVGTGRATGIKGAMGRIIPGSTANDFLGSLDSIQGALIMEKLQALKDASKTGASGMGALSEREGQRLASSVAALNKNMSAEKLLESLSAIERHAMALKAVGDGFNPDDPAIARKYGIIVDDPSKAAGHAVPPKPGQGGGPGGGEPQMELSRKTETVTDPALAGVNAKVRSIISRGGTVADVNAYLESVRPGLSQGVKNVGEWVRFHRRYPDKPIGVILDRVEKPLGPVRGAMNGNFLAPLRAYAMGAGDMVTGGTLDNMQENPALARAGMAGTAAAHPIANFLGQATGGVAMGLGAELGAARLGASGLASMLAGDVLPGALYGAGSSDEGGRLGGAVAGGLAGVVGGAAGRGLGHAVGGLKDAGVKRLADLGVPMTVPQMLGGGFKGLEDRLSTLPGFKSIIGGARTRGLEKANIATMDQAVAGIGGSAGGQTGEAGMLNLGDGINQGFKDALGGVNLQADLPYVSQVRPLAAQVSQIPRVGPELHAAIKETVEPMFGPGGQLTGEGMQAIDRGLSQLKSNYVNDPLYATHIAPAIDGMSGAIEGIVQRQAPDVLPKYRAAKEAYRLTSTVNDAVLAAKNTNGVFTPAQLGTAAVNNAKKFGSKMGAGRGERPFFELQRDMQNILPSKIPDPGTAGQMVIPGALAVLGGGAGGVANQGEGAGEVAQGTGLGVLGGLGAAGALASPYLARPLIQRLLTSNRPAWARGLGDVIGQSRLPGALALPLLLAPPE